MSPSRAYINAVSGPLTHLCGDRGSERDQDTAHWIRELLLLRQWDTSEPTASSGSSRSSAAASKATSMASLARPHSVVRTRKTRSRTHHRRRRSPRGRTTVTTLPLQQQQRILRGDPLGGASHTRRFTLQPTGSAQVRILAKLLENVSQGEKFQKTVFSFSEPC